MFQKSACVALLLIAFCVAAAAHPLGNFSINQYSRLEVAPSRIKIRQVLDMAEVPTFQESSKIDTDRDGQMSKNELDEYGRSITPPYLANLRLSVNGTIIAARAATTQVSLGSGAGNLPTLRIVWDLVADIAGNQNNGRISFQNDNFSERLGWREIVVEGNSGVIIFDSTAFGSGVTDELKAYPQESLSAPLNERAAEFSFTSGKIPVGSRSLVNRDGRPAPIAQKDRFAELIAVPEITPTVALFGLLLAFGLGALHAMSPGHGKAIVGAYLVGSRGTAKHAAFLGLTVTVTHTIGVFALGLITLFASNFILPERMMPFLSFVSGLLVFYIGITLFKNRLFAVLGWRTEPHHHHHGRERQHDHDGHAHSHGHDGHTHTHDGREHTHLPPEQITWRSLLALGISGGLLPCPSALVLMLSATSLGRVGYGLVLTLIFSLGLAATLTSVGLAFLYLGKWFGGATLGENRIIKVLPVASALVITFLGAVMCYTSLG